jgi:hypothetical protein
MSASESEPVILGDRPEEGCNCEHLPEGSTCYECSDIADVTIIADGGREVGGYPSQAVVGDERANVPHPDEPTDHLDASLDERVDELEDRVKKRRDVATDILAQLHDYQQLVEELTERVRVLEAAIQEDDEQ